LGVSGIRKMMLIDAATLLVAAASLPFVKFWLISVIFIIVGLPFGARAAVANEPIKKKRVLIISGTALLAFSCIYLIMYGG
jgi:hypothetical protein